MPTIKKPPKKVKQPSADWSASGLALQLSLTADESGLSVQDLVASKERLAESGLPATISPATVHQASALHRDKIDAALWRANGWIKQRVDEVMRTGDERKAVQPSPIEQETERAAKQEEVEQRQRTAVRQRKAEERDEKRKQIEAIPPAPRATPNPKRVL